MLIDALDNFAINMDVSALTVIDLRPQEWDTANYLNIPVAFVNDHVVRVSVMTGPYCWHWHPNSDETFLAMEGSLLIDLESETIELQPGQLFSIPKNVKHCTRPKGSRSVNLTFESANMETIIAK